MDDDVHYKLGYHNLQPAYVLNEEPSHRHKQSTHGFQAPSQCIDVNDRPVFAGRRKAACPFRPDQRHLLLNAFSWESHFPSQVELCTSSLLRTLNLHPLNLTFYQNHNAEGIPINFAHFDIAAIIF